MEIVAIRTRDQARLLWAWARHEFDRKVREPVRWWVIRRLPRWVVSMGLYRAGVDCMEPGEIVPEVPFMVVLNRWHYNKPAHGEETR